MTSFTVHAIPCTPLADSVVQLLAERNAEDRLRSMGWPLAEGLVDSRSIAAVTAAIAAAVDVADAAVVKTTVTGKTRSHCSNEGSYIHSS